MAVLTEWSYRSSHCLTAEVITVATASPISKLRITNAAYICLTSCSLYIDFPNSGIICICKIADSPNSRIIHLAPCSHCPLCGGPCGILYAQVQYYRASCSYGLRLYDALLGCQYLWLAVRPALRMADCRASSWVGTSLSFSRGST